MFWNFVFCSFEFVSNFGFGRLREMVQKWSFVSKFRIAISNERTYETQY
ncbi:hypothetical protein D1BOALGB6SA_10563 [Olavius sp. associated proteobacterium Delta 1]|nr:hypothetical protein D1BOALGB6SA_10563 [Olavius sp. associated proteobacterium Delta 1]